MSWELVCAVAFSIISQEPQMFSIKDANAKYRLYDYPHSGNTYKVKLALHQLRIPYTVVNVDILAGETHASEFAVKNPFEMVPALECIADGRVLAESNAILWHLARDTHLMPAGADAEVDALKWMFFEQNILEPNIGRARRLLHSEGLTVGEAGPQLGQRQTIARAGLELLDRSIGNRAFLVSERYSIADIAVFAYVHVAPEGGILLNGFTNIVRWIKRVSRTPAFISLDESAHR